MLERKDFPRDQSEIIARLSPERYQLTLAAQVKVIQRVPDVKGEDLLRQLLEQQYATQIALDGLGASSSTHPSELEMINQVLPPPEPYPSDRERGSFTGIEGMPNAGKSTIQQMLMGEFESVHFIGEHTGDVKRELDEAGLFDHYTLTIMHHGRQIKKLMSIFYPSGWSEFTPTTVVVDRSETDDIPFLTAHFVYGRISPENFQTLKSFISIPLIFTPEERDINRAAILCLITPNLSLEIEGPRDPPGRIINPQFLPVLYEQYLRFHYEAINFEKIYEKPRQFAYACLDFTVDPQNPNYEKNEHLLNKTIYEILRIMGKV